MKPVFLPMALACTLLWCTGTAQNKPAPVKKPTTPAVKQQAPAAPVQPKDTVPAIPPPDPYLSLLKTINTNVAPRLLWVNNAGGGGNDIAKDILVLENGYLILGETNSSNGDLNRSTSPWNVWLSYFDRKGNYVSGALYGGSYADNNTAGIFPNYQDSTITFFAQAASPETNSKPNGPYKHPEGDIWMVKVRMQDFKVVFQKTLGSNKEECPLMVKRLKNGNYLVAGSTKGSGGDVLNKRSAGEDVDIWLLILSADGTILKQQTYGGSKFEYVYDAISTADNQYLLIGRTQSKDLDFVGATGTGETAFAIKTDTLLQITWVKHFGHTDRNFYNLGVVNSNEKDGYIITTYPDFNTFAKNTKGRNDFVITKIDTAGNVMWYKNFGGSSSDDCVGILNDVKKEGYILYGNTSSNDGDVQNNHSNQTPASYPNRYFTDLWFVKVDNNGNLQWQKTVGGNLDDEIFKVKQFPDGAMIFAGQSDSKSGQVKGNKGSADYYTGYLSFTDSTVAEPNRTSLPSCSETQNLIADFTDIVECVKQKRAEEGAKLNKESVFNKFDIYSKADLISVDIVIDNCGILPKAPVVKFSANGRTVTLNCTVRYTGNGLLICSQAAKGFKNVNLVDVTIDGLPENCYYRILVHEK